MYSAVQLVPVARYRSSARLIFFDFAFLSLCVVAPFPASLLVLFDSCQANSEEVKPI